MTFFFLLSIPIVKYIFSYYDIQHCFREKNRNRVVPMYWKPIFYLEIGPLYDR